jgi:hypothetical protein
MKERDSENRIQWERVKEAERKNRRGKAERMKKGQKIHTHKVTEGKSDRERQ